MADQSNDLQQLSAAPVGDVEMADAADAADGAEGPEDVPPGQNDGNELPFAEGADASAVESRTTFLSHLQSPVVTLLLGRGESETILTAHQGLLIRSPFFAETCAAFSNDGSPRQIELANEDIDAVGCFLEYLYTGDYFPRRLPGQRGLEQDPAIPNVDETGVQLVKHARVYTLADKFGVDQLKSIASSKIHCVNSTAKGEIAYARYVYAHIPSNDTSIRGPVTNFWATRSHTLRSEAEDEFRALCLEFPQFGYDVLTRVLDEKLKREIQSKAHPSSSTSARKRARHSNA